MDYHPLPKIHNFKDLKGERFGRLVVLGYVGEYKKALWHCQCDCGKTTVVLASNLRRTTRPTRSCGCFNKDQSKLSNKTHGKHGTPEYIAWAGLKDRCLNPNSDAFKKYGAVGVTVSHEWKNSFEAFYADMGDRPSSQHSIDRKDNTKGYSVENCRWATKLEKTLNRTNTIKLTRNNIEKPLSTWAAELNIPYGRLKERYYSGYCEKCLFDTRKGVSCQNRNSQPTN